MRNEKRRKFAQLRNALPKSHSMVKLQGCLICHQTPINPFQLCCISYRTHSFNLPCKSVDRFLYNNYVITFLCNTGLKCIKYSTRETESTLPILFKNPQPQCYEGLLNFDKTSTWHQKDVHTASWERLLNTLWGTYKLFQGITPFFPYKH